MTNLKPRAVLFDADGVTIIPQAPFSIQYATAHGLDLQELGTFFDERFGEALVGKRDLKELLEERRSLWHWQGSIDDLLKQWFEAENFRNEELVKLIQHARQSGIQCFLATNQEKYRTQFIKEVMFPGIFDKVFSSADIGVKKPDPKYYTFIIEELQRSQIIAQPSDLAYFDDQSSNVESAKKLGIRAFLYSNVSQVEKVLQR